MRIIGVRQECTRILIAAVLAGCFSIGVLPTRAAGQTITSNKELKAALKTASTPDEHLRIATYFEKKAEALQKKEKEEQVMAAEFAAHPYVHVKTPVPDHSGLAQQYHQQARAALAKAKEHRDTAETLTARGSK